jgi:hypothetical protein
VAAKEKTSSRRTAWLAPILFLLAAVVAAGPASALTCGALETRVWEKTSSLLESRPVESLQLLNLHQQNGVAGYDCALGSPLAADGLASGNRLLQLPATDSSLSGTNILGYTTPSGDIYLQPGLSWGEQQATLLHESVHSFLSVPDSAPLAGLRQGVLTFGYKNSQLLRFTEEAAAETYSSGSLLKGISFPFTNGYVTPSGVLTEGAIYGGALFGAGYAGYRLGGGGD